MMMKSGCENASPRYRQRFRGYSVLVLSTTALVLCILTLGVGKVSAQEKSVRDGVYTEAQADRGAKLYGESCTGCHETGQIRRRTDEALGESVGSPLVQCCPPNHA